MIKKVEFDASPVGQQAIQELCDALNGDVSSVINEALALYSFVIRHTSRGSDLENPFT